MRKFGVRHREVRTVRGGGIHGNSNLVTKERECDCEDVKFYKSQSNTWGFLRVHQHNGFATCSQFTLYGPDQTILN